MTGGGARNPGAFQGSAAQHVSSCAVNPTEAITREAQGHESKQGGNVKPIVSC